MSIDRIAAAVAAFVGMRDIPLPLGETDPIEVVKKCMAANDPGIMKVVALVETMVSAYMGTTDLDMSVTARELMTLVSNGNVAKQFNMDIPDGPGKGAWEVIVRRARPQSYGQGNLLNSAAKPKLIIPGRG